mgnify:CR=1 FL=1
MNSGSINKVILIGHLGADPEVRYTQSGLLTASFSLATNEKYIDSDGNEQKTTEWHRIITWKKTAEFTEKYLKKGQLVFTEGKLQSRNWEDKDGIKRYTTEVVCEMFTMLGRKMDNENNQSPGSFSRPEQKTENTPDDEDLPF